MKVLLKVGLSGPAGAWSPGDEYECEAREAARLIEAGFAEPVAPRMERAVKPAPPVRRGRGGAQGGGSGS